MDIYGYKLCALGLYRLCNAQRTQTVFCRKELREKVYDRLDDETHATDRLKLCVIYKYGNITYKAR